MQTPPQKNGNLGKLNPALAEEEKHHKFSSAFYTVHVQKTILLLCKAALKHWNEVNVRWSGGRGGHSLDLNAVRENEPEASERGEPRPCSQRNP